MMSLSFMIEQLFAIDGDFRAGPFAEQHASSCYHVERGMRTLPASSSRPAPTRTTNAFLWFFLGGVAELNRSRLWKLFLLP